MVCCCRDVVFLDGLSEGGSFWVLQVPGRPLRLRGGIAPDMLAPSLPRLKILTSGWIDVVAVSWIVMVSGTGIILPPFFIIFLLFLCPFSKSGTEPYSPWYCITGVFYLDFRLDEELLDLSSPDEELYKSLFFRT